MMSGVQSHRRAAVAIGAALVGCAAATLVVSLSPGLRFAYRLPALHVSIETAAAVIGIVAAYLVAGRFQRRRRLDDLILAIALSLLAGTNLVFGTIPAALANGPTPFATWGAIAGRVLGGLAFAAAAFAPPLRKVCSQQAVRTMVAAPLVLLAAAVVVVALVHDSLPVGVAMEALG